MKSQTCSGQHLESLNLVLYSAKLTMLKSKSIILQAWFIFKVVPHYCFCICTLSFPNEYPKSSRFLKIIDSI